jgi:hypothetical protein
VISHITNSIVLSFSLANKITVVNRRYHSATPASPGTGVFECNGDFSTIMRSGGGFQENTPTATQLIITRMLDANVVFLALPVPTMDPASEQKASVVPVRKNRFVR